MVLIIGYGNELRGDDAVGVRAAEVLASLGLPSTRVLAVPQLTPELAEPLAHATTAIFIDAAVGGSPGQVDVAPCQPVDLKQPLGHISNPDALLALAEAVFRRTPSAWLVKIHVEATGLGQPLSPTAERAMAAAVAIVQRLVRQLGPEPSAPPAATQESRRETEQDPP